MKNIRLLGGFFSPQTAFESGDSVRAVWPGERCRLYKEHLNMYHASLTAQSVRNLPAMQEIQVRFLGREEGNGNPLQYSCLENPMDRRAWQATVHGVTRVGYDLATNPPPHVYQASLHHFSSEGGRLPVAGTIMVRLWPPQWEARCASV